MKNEGRYVCEMAFEFRSYTYVDFISQHETRLLSFDAMRTKFFLGKGAWRINMKIQLIFFPEIYKLFINVVHGLKFSRYPNDFT